MRIANSSKYKSIPVLFELNIFSMEQYFVPTGNEAIVSEVELQLQGDMESQRRLHPLIEDPDNICNKMEVSPDTFLNFLHQNYPPFYGSMDDMQLAAEFLSAGDFILSGWKFDDSGTRSFKVSLVTSNSTN